MLFAKQHNVSKLARQISRRRSLALGIAVAALSGGIAAASTNWTYVINFSHEHVIDESGQSGNFQIWGLGYARLIVGSSGSNVIVGDGSCPAGSTATDYCSVAPFKHSKSRVIYANGAGSNTIYAGYGPSVIFGGTGPNTITSAPTSSLIIGGNSGDTINADQGRTVVYAGTGTNTIYALSPEGDTVYCSGNQDTVYAYTIDRIYRCAQVVYESEPPDAVAHALRARHYRAPSLRHNRTARRLDARLKAAEKKTRR